MTARRCSAVLVRVCLLVAALGMVGCSGGSSNEVVTTTTTEAAPTTTTTEAPLDAGQQIFVYVPQVGDCFDRRKIERSASTSGQTDIVLKLDCSLPHRNEVYAVLDYPASDDTFPGEKALETFAKQECPRRFEGYVGKQYELSDLEIGYQLPDSTNWRRGTQKIGCYVYDLNGNRLVGTVQGSAR
ncbi:septum formation family protein [Rhabdothermincola sediminis]|uniref:septum formation family protein n=1 Tax=Rhabdothermincola sediminis TaxID=2751370 RepID=UPI001AA0878E|nr:septum formation family protein [Rhabdothermincola sediminis]